MGPTKIIVTAISAYQVVILGACVLTWVKADPAYPAVKFVRSITEPVFQRIRSAVRMEAGGFDFVPLAVFVVLEVLSGLLQRL